MGGKWSREAKIANSMKRRPESKTPIATTMIIPNYSGDHSAGTVLTTPANDTDIANKKYVDDNIGAGASGLWTSGAAHIYPIADADSKIVSGAGFLTTGSISGANVTSGVDPGHSHTGGFASGAYLADLSGALAADVQDLVDQEAQFEVLSGAHATHENQYDVTSGAAIALEAEFDILSGAHWDHEDQFDVLSGAFIAEEAQTAVLSGAFATHAADTSDPHGAAITQTSFSGANIMNTGDHNTSGAAYVVGIITHTSATPPTASGFPQGTLYIQYTA